MSARVRQHAAFATVLAALAGCLRGPLLDRAVNARGGPIGTVVVEAEAEVRRGYPGTWRWRRVFASPDRYAWTIFTTGAPLHGMFDGTVVRSFVGEARTSVDASPGAPLRSQARFVAVMQLDVLRSPGVQVAPMPATALPAGIAAGVVATWPTGGDRYSILFDERLLAVRVEGPVDLSPIGRGSLVARADDFRRVGRWWLPHRVVWELDGTEFADERARSLCVKEDALPAASFEEPERLPGCAAGSTTGR